MKSFVRYGLRHMREGNVLWGSFLMFTFFLTIGFAPFAILGSVGHHFGWNDNALFPFAFFPFIPLAMIWFFPMMVMVERVYVIIGIYKLESGERPEITIWCITNFERFCRFFRFL